MKKVSRRVLALILSAIMLCSIGVSAYAIEPRYSEYINSYTGALNTDSSGKLSVYVNLLATGVMTRLGAEKIRIFEKNGTYYSCVKTFESEDYPDMTKSGHRYMGIAATYQGTPEKSYYAVITLVAEDNTGSDTRTYTTRPITAG